MCEYVHYHYQNRIWWHEKDLNINHVLYGNKIPGTVRNRGLSGMVFLQIAVRYILRTLLPMYLISLFEE